MLSFLKRCFGKLKWLFIFLKLRLAPLKHYFVKWKQSLFYIIQKPTNSFIDNKAKEQTIFSLLFSVYLYKRDFKECLLCLFVSFEGLEQLEQSLCCNDI